MLSASCGSVYRPSLAFDAGNSSVAAVAVLGALPLVEREVDELSLTLWEPAEGQHHVPLVVGRQIKFGAIGQCTTIVGSAVVRQDRFFHQLDR